MNGKVELMTYIIGVALIFSIPILLEVYRSIGKIDNTKEEVDKEVDKRDNKDKDTDNQGLEMDEEDII